MQRIVIVGASLAGIHAAERIRELGFEGEVVLLSAEMQLPYDRPPLSKEYLRGERTLDEILLRPESWYSDNEIQLRLGSPAKALDTTRRRIELRASYSIGYDGLVIATGVVPRRLTSVAPNSPFVHTLRTLRDAARLRSALKPGKHLVVVGGGFVGLEVASTARARGVDVTVVERSSKPLARGFGPLVGDWFRMLHERHGVRFVHNCEIVSVLQDQQKLSLELSDGQSLHADVVLSGIGAVPATDWLRGSGVPLADGVLANADLSTGAPGVVAAGDVVRWLHPLFREEMRVEHWTNAVGQGRHAAQTLLGTSEPFDEVPYFWTDQYESKLRAVGHVSGTDAARVEREDTRQLVVSYGRRRTIRAAVTVDAPRELAKFQKAIRERLAWPLSAVS